MTPPFQPYLIGQLSQIPNSDSRTKTTTLGGCISAVRHTLFDIPAATPSSHNICDILENIT